MYTDTHNVILSVAESKTSLNHDEVKFNIIMVKQQKVTQTLNAA